MAGFKGGGERAEGGGAFSPREKNSKGEGTVPTPGSGGRAGKKKNFEVDGADTGRKKKGNARQCGVEGKGKKKVGFFTRRNKDGNETVSGGGTGGEADLNIGEKQVGPTEREKVPKDTAGVGETKKGRIWKGKRREKRQK